MAADDLFLSYLVREIGHPLDNSVAVEHMSGMQVVEALWPLNDVFRPVLEMVRSLPYQEQFEAAADDAIEQLVLKATPWALQQAPVWRILLERHQQAIVLAMLNERAGNPLMPIPQGLPAAARQGAAMLFLLHQMKLPFPVADRTGLELPVGAAPGSLARH
ncbi:hypothetical protein [Comamonas sp. A7-5]|uniref:hypothetical protein n=1 Tax=Comamonas sp. A7-5 TaxID=673549 RepID=UPI0031D1B3AC